MIKVACREQFPVNHPTMHYPGCDILAFREPPSRGSRGVHARNAVIMSNGVLDWHRPETWTGMIDRSPCGTGTCAIMAVMHARGQLPLHQDFVHEGILGTTFTGRLVESVRGCDSSTSGSSSTSSCCNTNLFCLCSVSYLHVSPYFVLRASHGGRP